MVDNSGVEKDGQVVIMAVDPGDTTGWCWLAVDRLDLCTLGTRLALKKSDLRYGQLQSGKTDAGENEVARQLAALTRSCWEWAEVEGSSDTFFVVLEHFVPRILDQSTSFLSPVRINAKYEYEMDGKGVRIMKQTASEAMTACTDERLKIWNVYDRGSGVHARDAQRHAVLAARKYASSMAFRGWAGYGLVA